MSKKSLRSASSASAILGNGTKDETPHTPTNCVVCSKKIPADRIKALVSLSTPATRFTHVACSTTTKVKGVYLGENGTSQIQLCDKLYNDSIRSVFRSAEVTTKDDEEPKEDDN